MHRRLAEAGSRRGRWKEEGSAAAAKAMEALEAAIAAARDSIAIAAVSQAEARQGPEKAANGRT